MSKQKANPPEISSSLRHNAIPFIFSLYSFYPRSRIDKRIQLFY